VPNSYNGGFGAPKDFEGSSFGGKGATTSTIPSYARVAPLMDEVRGMLKFGMNTFRIPFRSEYVYELWEHTWLVDNNDVPEYLPPNPHYLQMVVDLIENILAQEAPAGGSPIAVIFDMHNYMRWCPMGIGGTFSCLEPTGYNSTIQYHAKSACPSSSDYPDHSAFDAACPKNASSAQLKDYWDSPVKGTDFSGSANYEMNSAAWTCPLDFGKTPPAKSRWATCSMNNDGPPKSSKAETNPYSKVIGANCFSRMWKKLLSVPVSSKAFPGTCTPLNKVLAHYSDESKNSIVITPMNEPNMVETEDLAQAYKELVSVFRGEYQLQNRLLIEGNYWTGMHAQIDPSDRSAPGKHKTGCGAPGSVNEGSTKSGKMPLQVIHEALKGISNLGKWTFDVHQYFDFYSTGNHECGANFQNTSCTGTLEQVKDFVNWEKFIGYIHANKLSVAVTEFGGYPTKTCASWVRSFLTMLEQEAYDGTSGVILWTAWRVCPHTSWYAGINPTDPSADCVQFAEPQSFDPPEYAALWRTTSADDVKYGVKQVLKDFV